MSKRLTGVVLAFALTCGSLAGCAASKEVKETAGVSHEAVALQVPMAEAVASLHQVTQAAESGDLKESRELYQVFANSFGQVLGPISLRDVNLAQKMAVANSALKGALNAKTPDKDVVARESQAIMDSLNRAAERLGITVSATASAKVGEVVQNEARTIQVSAREYRFTPALIRVKQGTKVTIRFTNRGTEKHEFELDAFGVEIRPIDPGVTKEVTFVADKAGTFEYACHVNGHYEKGMRGYLVVE